MKSSIKTLAAALSAVAFVSTAYAEMTAAEVDRLGKDLTPFGAEKAGNKDGSIPAWSGGFTTPIAGDKPGGRRGDPFKDDKPPVTGFTIQPTQGVLTTLKYKMNSATPPVLVCDSFKYDDANLEIKIADSNAKNELSPIKMKFNFKGNVVLSTGEVLEVKPAIALQEIDLPIAQAAEPPGPVNP